jgi:hypothetical protein
MKSKEHRSAPIPASAWQTKEKAPAAPKKEAPKESKPGKAKVSSFLKKGD